MYEYNAIVTKIHDGDTLYARIDLGFWTWRESLVRLDKISCPELGTIKNPNPPGEEATLYLMGLLADRSEFSTDRSRGYFGNFGDYLSLNSYGPQIRIETRLGGDTEKYGRVLGTVRRRDGNTVDPVTLNARMLDSGFAVPL